MHNKNQKRFYPIIHGVDFVAKQKKTYSFAHTYLIGSRVFKLQEPELH